jgi:hypothetical protein
MAVFNMIYFYRIIIIINGNISPLPDAIAL